MALQDSHGDLLVPLLPEDVACATPGDPANCAIAQALRRVTGSNRVEVHRTVVRVDLLDEHGEYIPTRFRLRKNITKMIEHFDQTGDMPAGPVVLSKTADSSYSLKSKREQMRRHHAGETVPHPQRRPKRAPDPEVRQYDRAQPHVS